MYGNLLNVLVTDGKSSPKQNVKVRSNVHSNRLPLPGDQDDPAFHWKGKARQAPKASWVRKGVVLKVQEVK